MTITAGPQAAADTFQLSGQQLTNMLDSISDGFIAFDRDWRFTFINRAAAEHHFQKLLSSEAAQFVELRLLHRTGMYRWIEFSTFPQFENGVITHLWGIGRDITERKQTNQALHQIIRQNSQLATAIASTTTGVVISDPHLPDIPGAEVLHRLQNAPDTRAIPVVVISASGMQPQIQRLLAAGAHTYLTKPINIKRLLATIDAIIQLANKGI